MAELPNAAKAALDEFGENAASVFLMEPGCPRALVVAEDEDDVGTIHI